MAKESPKYNGGGKQAYVSPSAKARALTLTAWDKEYGMTYESKARKIIRKAQRNAEKQAAARAEGKIAFNRSSFGSALRRAHEYTQDNYDFEASRTMANYFKYDDLTKDYNALIKEYEKAGSLTSSIEKKQKKLDWTLYDRVSKDYGKDIADEMFDRM